MLLESTLAVNDSIQDLKDSLWVGLPRDVLATRDFHTRAGQQAREDKTAMPYFSELRQRLDHF